MTTKPRISAARARPAAALPAGPPPVRSPRSAAHRRRFVAIDFETADEQRDSACALAMVCVQDDEIVERRYCLIRPPRRQFVFSYVHGITWKDVASQPSFGELWPKLSAFL